MVARITALFLALLIGIGTILPLATQRVQAESGPKHKKHAKRYKKYSKGWWRQYRARMKRKRAMQLAKRKIRLEQLRLEKDRTAQDPSAPVKSASKPNTATAKKAESAAPAVLPSGDPAPTGWKPAPSTSAELQFRVDNSSGVQIGSAAISVVGPSIPSGSSRNKSIGGVTTSSLRRDVIDKMIKENGWVVNDFQKEVDGQQVYVVVAQSQAANGSLQSRMFYFTEVDGRIYSVSTKSPAQDSERLAEESEKVINSLKNTRPSQRAAVKQQ
jgi:hypothetical protein